MPLVLSTGFPQDKLAEIKKGLGVPVIEPINSVGIKVGALVRQEADIYFSHHPVHYWDSCAPQVILEEAGGVMTDLQGNSFIYDLTGSHEHKGLPLASNGTRHQDLVRILTTSTPSF